MEHKSITHVILTGGVVGRLTALVKVNLSNILIFFDGRSLFEMTVDRNKNIC
jgi:mannose-1-phosphate guanylyltransferase